jgi:hypothetical protein
MNFNGLNKVDVIASSMTLRPSLASVGSLAPFLKYASSI